MRTGGIVAVGVAGALSLAACASSSAPSGAGSTPLAASTPSAPSPSHSPSVAVSSPARHTGPSTATSRRLIAANAALSSALVDLARASSRARDTSSLAAPRGTVRTRLALVRRELGATRSAAYDDGPRSCSTVWAHASAADDAAAAVSAARDEMTGVTRRMRSAASALESRRAGVHDTWNRLSAALERTGATVAGATVPDRVGAALHSAGQLRTATLAAAAQADAAAAEAVAKARDMRGRAAQIADRTCP